MTERDAERVAERAAREYAWPNPAMNALDPVLQAKATAFLAGVAWERERWNVKASTLARLQAMMDEGTKARIQELEAQAAVMREALEHYSKIADDDGAAGRDRRTVARQALSSSAPSEMLERVKRLEAALNAISCNGNAMCLDCKNDRDRAYAALEGGKG